MDTTALVPVLALQLPAVVELGPYRLIPPADEFPTPGDHPWFSNLVGASGQLAAGAAFHTLDPARDPAWLLSVPLIECTVPVGSDELTLVGATMAALDSLVATFADQNTVPGESPDPTVIVGVDWTAAAGVVREIASVADAALDVLRLAHVHFKNAEVLAQLPGRAGQVVDPTGAGWTVAFLPEHDLLIRGKPSPVQTLIQWAGLEANPTYDAEDRARATVMSGVFARDLDEVVRGTVRTMGHAFYAGAEEIQLVTLISALESLVALPKNRKGWPQRLHIAMACRANTAVTAQTGASVFHDAVRINELYVARNGIAHSGDLLQDPYPLLQDAYTLLNRALRTVEDLKTLGTSDELTAHIEGHLNSPAFQAAYAATRPAVVDAMPAGTDRPPNDAPTF